MLNCTYDELQRAVARRLGYPLLETNQSADEKQSIADCIRCGLRWFYFPTGENTHVWSFMRRYLEITLVDGKTWYGLPDNFARIAERPTISSSSMPVAVTDEAGIRLRLNGEGSKGTPAYCGIRSKDVRGDTRYEIGVYPTPDATLINAQGTLQMRYLFEPQTLSASDPFALGGGTHAETIVAACLAAAEAQMNPETMAQEGGVHWQYFQQQLAASVVTDQILVGA